MEVNFISVRWEAMYLTLHASLNRGIEQRNSGLIGQRAKIQGHIPLLFKLS